jgi:hypothetical protein
MELKRYRKKPIVIEAGQWHLLNNMPGVVIPVWISQDGRVLGEYTGQENFPHANLGFGIKTLEGWHVVIDGDWIILGIKGEKYPCKPDIFEMSYEEVEEA